MSQVKIKICGLMRECDIEYVNRLKPEYIGFIFAEGRRRRIEVDDAARFKRKLSEEIEAVGVFVNQSINYVADIAANNIIDIIQLHGSEDESYIRNLQNKTDKKIIKAIRIETVRDIQGIDNCVADYVLLDNGIGGTGESFDWSLVKDIGKPFFIAGGIGANNVKEALRLQPYAIDVSSSVETNGYKDYDKIQEIIALVREQ